MTQLLWLLLILSLVIVSHLAPLLAAAIVSSTSPAPSSLPGCPSKCGKVDIPYPFGIGADCAWQGEGGGFTVHCNESSRPTPSPYIGGLEIQNISVETGEINLNTPVAHRCYNSSTTIESKGKIGWDVSGWPFRISPTRNVFTAIGCSTVAFLEGKGASKYITGCISYCEESYVNNEAKDGQQCTGLGCCQTVSVPAKLDNLEVNWGNDDPSDNYSAWSYSPCSYAFVAAKGWYHFKRLDLNGRGNDSFTSRVGRLSTVPLVLDWTIKENGSCQVDPQASGASGKLTAPACVSTNSECVGTAEGDGYRCNCTKGYRGNPYVTDGCTNINECNSTAKGPCGIYSTCHDTEGGYICKCKFNRQGNGKSEKGCDQHVVPIYAIAIPATFVFILLLAVLLWFVRKEHKQRLRRGFFDRNGGKLLEGVDINVYTEGQLEKITNKYSSPIGRGHFGNVFMGTTEDNKRVAVKRAIREDGNKPPEGGDFVHEILFQFQMRHKNLVRLVGCCLETSNPMLVFEFVSSGSLSDVLHGAGKLRAVSLLERLDIAIGSAEALAYMHSHGHHKRIHGDVKSANILLDDDLSPKVSDFGSSKVVSPKSRYVRLVASDINYVDPVYMRTDCFTEKSDVYSFAVVLLELITRKAVKYDGNNSLSIDFSKLCKVEGNGRKMYDRDILTNDGAKSHVYIECLDRMGALAIRCLSEDVDERPTMSEVLEELKQVKAIACRGSSSEES